MQQQRAERQNGNGTVFQLRREAERWLHYDSCMTLTDHQDHQWFVDAFILVLFLCFATTLEIKLLNHKGSQPNKLLAASDLFVLTGGSNELQTDHVRCLMPSGLRFVIGFSWVGLRFCRSCFSFLPPSLSLSFLWSFAFVYVHADICINIFICT